MSHLHRLFWSAGLVLVVMAALAVLEGVAAFHKGSIWRRDHLSANLGLTVMTLGLAFALAIVTSRSPLQGRGLLERSGLQPTLAILIGVGVLDFATYAAHWLMHRVPLFWRVHRVHHADPLVDVTTALRQHPLEGVLRFAFILAPALALGLPPEAVMIYRLLSVLNALLEHMNIRVCHPQHPQGASLEATARDGLELRKHSLCVRSHLPDVTPTARAEVDYGLEGYDATERQRFGALLRLPFLASIDVKKP